MKHREESVDIILPGVPAITLFSGTFTQVLLPIVSKMNASGDSVGLYKVVNQGSKYANILLTTIVFTFVNSNLAESVLTGELKEELEKFLHPTFTVSNSALTISNDGTNIKLTNSAPSENVMQQATFTFFEDTTDGGGGGGEIIV